MPVRGPELHDVPQQHQSGARQHKTCGQARVMHRRTQRGRGVATGICGGRTLGDDGHVLRVGGPAQPQLCQRESPTGRASTHMCWLLALWQTWDFGTTGGRAVVRVVQRRTRVRAWGGRGRHIYGTPCPQDGDDGAPLCTGCRTVHRVLRRPDYPERSALPGRA